VVVASARFWRGAGARFGGVKTVKIISRNFALLLCALSPTLLMAGCPDAVYCRGGVCTGYYYDSLVSGLTYESRSDGVVTHTGVTGENNDPERVA